MNAVPATIDDHDAKLYVGDVRDVLASLPEASVQTCVTSPPYWGLRDYGVDGQIGLEESPEAFVAAMVDVSRGVRRVLRDDGTLWLNLGDSYARGRSGRDDGGRSSEGRAAGWREGFEDGSSDRATPDGFKPKDLVGIPWRVAFALQADGWWLRSAIVWAKPNPMPESVTDRPTSAYEMVFLLAKSARYFYDADAIREEQGDGPMRWGGNGKHADPSLKARALEDAERNQAGRNARNVWSIATQPYPEALFATFPEELPKRCILAGSREGDVVLDPFAGSGTTLFVARKLGRRSVGIELNEDYARLAGRRLAQQALV